jgi:hypothetical protein
VRGSRLEGQMGDDPMTWKSQLHRETPEKVRKLRKVVEHAWELIVMLHERRGDGIVVRA